MHGYQSYLQIQERTSWSRSVAPLGGPVYTKEESEKRNLEIRIHLNFEVSSLRATRFEMQIVLAHVARRVPSLHVTPSDHQCIIRHVRTESLSTDLHITRSVASRDAANGVA